MGTSGERRNLLSGSYHLHLRSWGRGGNDSCLDGGGGGEGNSNGSGLAVVCHCGAEAVLLVCRVLNVPDPTVGVSNSIGSCHDVAVSALLPLL